MARYNGRVTLACHHCHASKVKCTGGVPCERCRHSSRECSYPVKDRPVTVSESYLRGLEREARRARRAGLSGDSDQSDGAPTPAGNAATGPASGSPGIVARPDAEEQQQTFGDCSAEVFVKTLKELPFVKEPELPVETIISGDGISTSRYTYSPLDFDFLQPKVSFKLPPKPYASYLLQVFEEGFCDYHWYTRTSFGERLAQTYDDPSSQAHDRTWLCQLSVVLALGQTWLHGRTKEGGSTRRPSNELLLAPPKPPGTDFFEQSLLLLKPSLEEPTIADVEVLNLIAFYSYSLNRRRTAYFYARQAISMAQCLGIHESPPRRHQKATAVHSEHLKRVWWTCYCIHQMISTELGLPSLYDCVVDWSQPPSSVGLGAQEMDQFFNGELLTAHAKICLVRAKIIKVVTRGLPETESGGLVGALSPCVDSLQQWRHELPAHMLFTFENGIGPEMAELPYSRALASLYLRYHQCIILLLRPLLLRDISNLTRKRTPQPEQGRTPGHGQDEELRALKSSCLEAARSNCKILLSLETMGMIAKFGYWESLHLFTGITMLLLFQVVPALDAQTLYLHETTDCEEFRFGNQTEIYERSRALLTDMATVGNPAAKDHLNMLTDVETLVRNISIKEHVSLSFHETVWPALEAEGEVTTGSLWDPYNIDWDSLLYRDPEYCL